MSINETLLKLNKAMIVRIDEQLGLLRRDIKRSKISIVVGNIVILWVMFWGIFAYIESLYPNVYIQATLFIINAFIVIRAHKRMTLLKSLLVEGEELRAKVIKENNL